MSPDLTSALRCYVRASRSARGLPPLVGDPAAMERALDEARRDPRAVRLAAAIRREVDTWPPLSPEQIERLRGLLPYPYPCSPAGEREAESA